MNIEQAQIMFSGMESSDALQSYVFEKIGKHTVFLERATSMDVRLIDNSHHKGVKTDFRIEVDVLLPKTKIHVDATGDNMYSMIDIASDMLGRRLKRYHDKFNQWEGIEPWKLEEVDVIAEEESTVEPDNYTNYVPKVTARRKMHDMRPMEEAEAIEFMELMGHKQLLFKNSKTGKISMVYKREFGGYGLVEPQEEV